ncbi:LacI family DNA-binding transcriptional regulator, partial [Pseudophaeobacter sp.]|uniref:LacI family DNA-binding transcriptional regulator n=1 Tax=Pseudophaeobacter sp. TaxID=1971739 RepID=UPI0032991941
MKSATTLKDVAQKAGCGIATVSRVLNGKGPVSEVSRQRVLQAAQALGFEFNETARALQSQRSRTIGCLVPSLVNPVFADAVQALQAAVQAADYHLILMCSDYDAAQEASILRMLIQKGVDALALTVSDASDNPGLEMLRNRGLPHCLMFNAPAQDTPCFYVDNAAASARVARAFYDQGHRQTGFLALRFHRSDRSRQRFDGYRAACHSLGIADPELLEVDQEPSRLGDQLGQMLAQGQGLSGIYAS